MQIKTLIFDLDGTLLDTLPDLVVLTNTVLSQLGFPTRTQSEVLSYVGGGARVLLRKALPETADEATLDKALRIWKSLYPELGHGQTKPYPHMHETLQALRCRGVRLGVLSNKFDAAACEVIDRFLPNLFDDVRGERSDTPRKPDPAGLLSMIERMEASADTTAYVGDSAGDIVTAHRANVKSIAVSWGYQDKQRLLDQNPDYLIDNVADMLHLVNER